MSSAADTPGSSSQDSSVDLLKQARLGDQSALDRLLARYLPRLQQWARGRLPAGARTTIDTGDLVQDAVIAAIRRLETLEIRHDRAIEAYLRQAINNRIIDAYRHASRRPPQVDLPKHVAAGDASPLDAAIDAQTKQHYHAALAALSKEDREAIVLRVERGFDYAEIAVRLNKSSAGAARMAISRALARLAREMHRARSAAHDSTRRA